MNTANTTWAPKSHQFVYKILVLTGAAHDDQSLIVQNPHYHDGKSCTIVRISSYLRGIMTGDNSTGKCESTGQDGRVSYVGRESVTMNQALDQLI